jgi:membrane associated rhomboid family serine protease
MFNAVPPPEARLGAPIPTSILFVTHQADFGRMSLHSHYFNRLGEVEPNPGLKSPPSTRPMSVLPLVAILRGHWQTRNKFVLNDQGPTAANNGTISFMIPLRDANPSRHTPVVTVALIVINVLVYLYQWTLSGVEQLGPFFDTWAIIPAQLTGSFGTEFFTLFTAMFMHGSWLHLGGNMLYLWIFGDNIEDILGATRYILFYLIGGLVATAAQVIVDPNSPIPNLGASGAIAAVLGGYLVLYPRARVTTLVFRFITQVPAYVVLGFWFVLQLFQGLGSLGTFASQSGGVAFFAHVGGFVAGLILIRPLQRGARSRPDRTIY